MSFLSSFSLEKKNPDIDPPPPKKIPKKKINASSLLTSAAPDVLGRLPECRQVIHAPRGHLRHGGDRDLGHHDDLVFVVFSAVFSSASTTSASSASSVAAVALLQDDRRLHHLDLLVLRVQGRVVVGDVAGGRAVLRVQVGQVADDGELRGREVVERKGKKRLSDGGGGGDPLFSSSSSSFALRFFLSLLLQFSDPFTSDPLTCLCTSSGLGRKDVRVAMVV